MIAVGSCKDDMLKSQSSDMVEFEDEINEFWSPLPYVVPLQLLSYHMSVARGLDPDKPKNLAKCVTVE